MFAARAINQIAGGVERAIITVMNDMAARGHDVELFTWDPADATAFYPMSPNILWHRLNLGDPRAIASQSLRLRRALAVRSLVSRSSPQAIICFQDGPFLALRTYTAGMRIPVIAAERNAPTRFEFTTASRQRWLMYNSFRFAARIVVQCASYRQLYPAFLQKKIIVIPNPVFPAAAEAVPDRAENGRYRLLSVGRLSYQKNYPVLIEAFASLATEFPEWDLSIVGEGEDRDKLEKLIAERGLTARVFMRGVTTSVSRHYVKAHLFCLPSRWEGFPNAMAEALACGLPCVGFAECSGVRDLIVDSENGLLARGNGHSLALASSLKTLMTSAEARRRMGKRAVASVRRYQPDDVMAQWERTFSEVALV